MESILTSTKKLLGIAEDYTHFDTDLVIHINSVLSTLSQLGAGPSEGFSITGSDETWEDFIGSDPKIQFIKSYVYLKVKLLFDPPLSSSVAEAANRQISELEWRIFVQADKSNGGDG